MMKPIRMITGFLGMAMFMFGILKFVNPFKAWYTAQVAQSELPNQTLSYWSGQLGEIAVGLIFLILLLSGPKLTQTPFNQLFYIGNLMIIPMMLTAFYVHLHPNVSAEVLPLKLRPPLIPGVFLLLAGLNLFLKLKTSKKKLM